MHRAQSPGRIVGYVLLLSLAGAAPAPARFAPVEGKPYSIYATHYPNRFIHNVGLLHVMITNVGIIGNPWDGDINGASWRGGDYLYAAGLWVGAIASDNLAYVSTGVSPLGETELLPSLDPRDTIYTTFEGATGGERAGFSASQGDDDGDGARDEDPLNGRDDDQDGAIDEDFEAISQQMFSCTYWDYLDTSTSQNPEHRPLHLEVRQRSFAWSTEGANEFIGFDYQIENTGFEILRDIYIGYYVDSDAGDPTTGNIHTDDGGTLRTIDTTYVDQTITYSCTDRDGTPRNCAVRDLHLDIALMHDTPGSEMGGEASDDLPAGANGYFGGMFLGHTTDPTGERAPERVQIHTCRFFSGGGAYPGGDPRNDHECYDLLASGDTPRRHTQRPADYRYAFSAGPFDELLPGEELEFQVAFVIGNEMDGLVDNAINAQRVFDGKWRDTDGNAATGCWGRETCLRIEPGGERVDWHDPCDSLSPAITISNTECHPDGQTNWADADCNCCTPRQADASRCDGWERLVHWVGTVAPPPPVMNTEDQDHQLFVAGDREVRLEWDNSSELVPDPITQEILFCGYRIWRVEGWTRPVGSSGPAPDEWELIADLWGDDNHLRLEALGSQRPLREFTNPWATPVGEIPSPTEPGRYLTKYGVGRYFYIDDVGLKNGMLYFYDITAYSCWQDSVFDEEGRLVDVTYHELSSMPAAVEDEGVRPIWSASGSDHWKDQIMVVPNPWRGGAAWDLVSSAVDPTGTHIDFVGLPQDECDLRIYTLAGDLVQTLHQPGSAGAGTLRWNLLSRNGQDITSGVYLYGVNCGGESKVGRFTVIR